LNAASLDSVRKRPAVRDEARSGPTALGLRTTRPGSPHRGAGPRVGHGPGHEERRRLEAPGPRGAPLAAAARALGPPGNERLTTPLELVRLVPPGIETRPTTPPDAIGRAPRPLATGVQERQGRARGNRARACDGPCDCESSARLGGSGARPDPRPSPREDGPPQIPQPRRSRGVQRWGRDSNPRSRVVPDAGFQDRRQAQDFSRQTSSPRHCTALPSLRGWGCSYVALSGWANVIEPEAHSIRVLPRLIFRRGSNLRVHGVERPEANRLR
jgi:hypothetical protein